MQRIVGQGRDVLEFLLRIELGFVDEADLPAGVPAQLIGGNDAEQR